MRAGMCIKPETAVTHFIPCSGWCGRFKLGDVAPIVGMSTSFICRVLGKRCSELTEDDLNVVLEQDAFHETFVPRSKVVEYLKRRTGADRQRGADLEFNKIYCGDATDLIKRLPNGSVQCVVTSTPYWAMRVYDELFETEWADGEVCAFGLEQTPEGFIRHSVEVLYELKPKISDVGSVWWNIMDSFNTRTQIRGSAVEALHAMQGKDKRSWKDHQYKRYSAGHSFLKDGEQCLIPSRIAERASRVGYYVKSIVSWCKTSSLPEPQKSRVSRSVEYILHLSIQRTPKFKKAVYLSADPILGGKQDGESDKLSDYWFLPTSSGRDGHGAQFPLPLPGRCIGLTSDEGDFVLDPFAGAGTTLQAAKLLGRKYIGFDVSKKYVSLAESRLQERK